MTKGKGTNVTVPRELFRGNLMQLHGVRAEIAKRTSLAETGGKLLQSQELFLNKSQRKKT